ncbi:hypothetical protein BP5796_02008 [Coleophoma crateriformis]|uniref:MAGE domain-containing protein n=1 Tax=Coleophoma crateriformis TaxID=565419 RepID=A0A3D8T251_9HELO|nr:hypothetical protein BP5796_02008 [Coleophoma crateriformis]
MPSGSRKRRAPVEAEDESEEEVQNTQKARRRVPEPAESEDGEEDDAQDAEDAADADMDGNENGQDQAVKKFVRLAMACEFGRVPITRTVIREKVLSNSNARAFRRVFEDTQVQLRTKFGMEMVPLPSRDKHLLRDKINAQKTNAKSKSTQSYILTSILPKAYRTPTIMPPSTVESPAAEATYIGLYTVVISLIALNGDVLPDHKLARYLERLNADQMMGNEKTDFVLKKMERQGYIFKTTDNQGDEQVIEWHVGPRGKTEVGNRGIKGLVTEVYGQNAPQDLDKRIHSSLGMEVLTIEEVERAARQNNREDQAEQGESEAESEPEPEPEPEPEQRTRRNRRG